MKKPVFVAPIPTGDAVIDDALYIKHHRQYMKDLAAYEAYLASPMVQIESILVKTLCDEIDREILKRIMK